MGMTSGKLRIARSVALLLALADMADKNVKVMARPLLPRNIASRKTPASLTGLLLTKLIAPQINRLMSSRKPILYTILATKTAMGLTRV